MPCAPTDISCQIQEAIVNIIAPYVLPIILFIVCIVGIIAARTFKGKAFWGLILFLEVWWFFPITGFTLKQFLGLA